MHRLTLFGTFVEGLRMTLTDVGGRRFKKSDLVFLITGQSDTSQASRYLRVFDEEKSTFWYHKSTIARMIASAGQGAEGADGLIRRKARGGYEFIGSPDSEVSLRVLDRAITSLWNESDDCFVLREALERAGIGPESDFCKKIYAAYAAEYGRDDLYECVLTKCGGLTGSDCVRETYKTLLVCVLLGPTATALITGTNAVTPSGKGGSFQKMMDGFSLIQLVESEEGMLLPANALGFELGSVVTIGREPSEEVAYVPLRAPRRISYVSGLHARVRPTVDGTAWELCNLSGSNGTTVYHVADGSTRFMQTTNEVEPLMPGDEVWLAPLPPGKGTRPSYDMGAVVRFEHLYKYVVQ
ncbi:MAG: FHA domain-containing protein [Atopobiaceae bacterium]|nr:FHA domain-containing protein [Atopobiaceae bacterium]